MENLIAKCLSGSTKLQRVVCTFHQISSDSGGGNICFLDTWDKQNDKHPTMIYYSLAKQCRWMEHTTSFAKEGGGHSLNFNCERALMYVYSYSCLLELTGNLGWTSTTEPPAFEAPVLMAHNTLNGNMPHSASLVPSLALLSLRSWTLSGKRYADMFTSTHSNNQHTDTHAHTHTPTKSCYPIKEGTWTTKVLAVEKD